MYKNPKNTFDFYPHIEDIFYVFWLTNFLYSTTPQKTLINSFKKYFAVIHPINVFFKSMFYRDRIKVTFNLLWISKGTPIIFKVICLHWYVRKIYQRNIIFFSREEIKRITICINGNFIKSFSKWNIIWLYWQRNCKPK